MNWDQIEGEWKQVKGHVKAKWAKLTDDDMSTVNGKKDTLVGRIQQRYGILKDEAEKQVDEWIASFKKHDDTTDDQKPSDTNAPRRRVG
jgi:uncharacterized protein YjbJ (UPF0337 family)